MARKLLERRLIELSGRLKRLHEELHVVDEQLAHLAGEAEDARIRSLVSETPLADREHREARKHVEAMQRHRAEVVSEIDKIEASQNDLLDRLASET